jgi:hypothetical protein
MDATVFPMKRYLLAALAVLLPLTTQAQRRTPRDSTRVLIGQLAAQHAQFGASPAIGGFNGNKEPFDALSALFENSGDTVLVALTDCFTDSRPTALRYKGRPLSRGGLCYLMLHNLVYHEDDDDKWAGNYFGVLSARRLAAAQRAWRRIIRMHYYDEA